MFKQKDFLIVPHMADIKIRVFGNNYEKLFVHALIGMFQCIRPQAPTCYILNERVVCDNLPIERLIECTAIDIEALLITFLSEALYLSDVENEAYFDARVIYFTDTACKIVVCGVAITGFDGSEIKAVTYHDLHIVRNNEGWQVDIVFDI